jgi:hypothetical protein
LVLREKRRTSLSLAGLTMEVIPAMVVRVEQKGNLAVKATVSRGGGRRKLAENVCEETWAVVLGGNQGSFILEAASLVLDRQCVF